MIGNWAHRCLHSINFDNLPADVTLRLMSNFGRCLFLQAPSAPCALKHDLQRLLKEANRTRHRHSRAQEDHPAFLSRLLKAVETGTKPPILTVETSVLREQLQRFCGLSAPDQLS